jgi:hypothetical protein
MAEVRHAIDTSSNLCDYRLRNGFWRPGCLVDVTLYLFFPVRCGIDQVGLAAPQPISWSKLYAVKECGRLVTD